MTTENVEFNHNLEDNGKMYNVRLLKTMGGRTIQKMIQLPFRPTGNLVITVSEEESYRVSSTMWDVENNRFNAQCLTKFEAIRSEPYIIQPRYGQKDYDDRIEMHLEMGWEEVEK